MKLSDATIPGTRPDGAPSSAAALGKPQWRASGWPYDRARAPEDAYGQARAGGYDRGSGGRSPSRRPPTPKGDGWPAEAAGTPTNLSISGRGGSYLGNPAPGAQGGWAKAPPSDDDAWLPPADEDVVLVMPAGPAGLLRGAVPAGMLEPFAVELDIFPVLTTSAWDPLIHPSNGAAPAAVLDKDRGPGAASMKITAEALRGMVSKAIFEAKKEKEEPALSAYQQSPAHDFSRPLGPASVPKKQGAANFGPLTADGSPGESVETPAGGSKKGSPVEEAFRLAVRAIVHEASTPAPTSAWMGLTPPRPRRLPEAASPWARAARALEASALKK